MVRCSRVGLAATLLCLAVPGMGHQTGGTTEEALTAPKDGVATEVGPAEVMATQGHDRSDLPSVEEKSSPIELSAFYTADVQSNVRGGGAARLALS